MQHKNERKMHEKRVKASLIDVQLPVRHLLTEFYFLLQDPFLFSFGKSALFVCLFFVFWARKLFQEIISNSFSAFYW